MTLAQLRPSHKSLRINGIAYATDPEMYRLLALLRPTPRTSASSGFNAVLRLALASRRVYQLS